MPVPTIDNAKASNVREVLAFVLRTEFLGRDLSWMALRERLEYALEHWPSQIAPQATSSRRAATEMVRELQKTFVAGRSARAVAIGAEVPLARFAGSSMAARQPFTVRDSDPAGQWWFDERWLGRFDDAMTRIDPRGGLWPDRAGWKRDLFRDRLAVRHDWNTMSRMWRLHLPPGAALIGLVGRTRRQPTWSRELVLLHDANEFLPGGLEQYYIPHLDRSIGWRVSQVG
ncbi:MAG TPA: hypothetical protein VMM18_15240 [Gemmatimonadaceae bacterium]|nr:hypothetical protein [Gemmatimonadaceae bacterium]